MSLEVATFIDQLDGANPPGTDLKSQGDDHLRLIKNVLKNSIKRVTRAFYVPSITFKVGAVSYAVLATDDNMTFVGNTAAGDVTLTLPALAASDAGWCIYVQKNTTDANVMYIVPPSGTINGFTKIRRSSEYHITKVLWNGANYLASRPHGLPIGSSIPFHGTTLPNGYLWPDGTTFTAANYVELSAALGGNTKPDLRGRLPVGKDNMGGSAANRVTTAGSGVDGTTLGASGGAQNVTLDTTMIPAHLHSINDPGHRHSIKFVNPGTAGGGFNAGIPDNAGVGSSADAIQTATTGITQTNNTGGGAAHNNMPPAIIANYVLVAE